MLDKFIGWVENHPWLTLSGVAALTVFFAGAVSLRGLTFESDFTKFLPQDNPAVAAANRARETYGDQDLFLIALEAPETIFNPSTLRKFYELERELEALPAVDKVRGPASADVIYGTENAIVVEQAMPRPPETPEEIALYRERVLGDRNLRGLVVAEDGKSGAISLKLELGVDAPPVVAQIQEIVKKYEGPEKIYLAGEPVLRSVIAITMTQDLRRLVPFVVLVMLAVLFLSFRSLRGVALPLAVVLVSTVWAVGTMALFHQPMTPFTVIMPVMLIAIGAADGIHILNKYYEEAAIHHQGRRRIVLVTMKEMASPVIMTSLTTAAGFLALLTSFLWPQRSFGVITALGVLYAMVLSLTLIPASLARLALPRGRQDLRAYSHTPLSEVLAALARLVGRRPGWTLAVSLAVLAVFAVAVPRLRVETQPDEFLGEDHPAIQAMHVIDRDFGGSRQLAIEIRTGRRDGLKDPEVLRRIAELQDYLLGLPEVGQVASVAKVVMQMNETLHASDPAYYKIPEDPRLAAQLFILYSGDLDNLALGDFSRGEVVARVHDLSTTQIVKLAERVERHLAETFGDGPLEAEMVGATREYAALLPLITRSQLSSLLSSLVAAFLIVALLMRSWAGGVASVLPLIFTLVIAFGSMVFLGLAVDMATLMLGSITIGIGIDYGIHFISRYRQELVEGADWTQAYENTVRTVGKGIFYNALSLMLSFGVLLVSSFQGNANFGRLIVLTMIVSSLSAMTVIPALFILWKPAFLVKRARAGRSEPAVSEGSAPARENIP